MVIWGLSTVFFFRDQSFKLFHLKLENEHPAGKKSDAFQHQQYQPIAMSHYITASASLDNIFCEREGVDSQYLITPTYNVCNGFSNQILGHAAFIAHSIKSSNMGSSHDKLKIPNAFIVNGVQSKENVGSRARGELENVFANGENSIPLSDIVDTNHLLAMVRERAVDACLVPYEELLQRQRNAHLMNALGSSS